MAKSAPHIHKDLRSLAKPVKSFVVDPLNAKQHDERSIDAIAASFKRFGQRKPIVVQKRGMIVRAGNGALLAARKLGWQLIAAVIVDEDAVEATAFGLADNRTNELGHWDVASLARSIHELKGMGVETEELGWTAAETEAILAALPRTVEGTEDESQREGRAQRRAGRKPASDTVSGSDAAPPVSPERVHQCPHCGAEVACDANP